MPLLRLLAPHPPPYLIRDVKQRALHAAAACAVWFATAATGGPATPTPDELAGLAAWPIPPGFHEDGFGCYVPNVPTPTVAARPIPPPQPRAQTADTTQRGNLTLRQFSGQDELTYHIVRAQYAAQQNDVKQVIAEYRIAARSAQTEGAQPNYVDYVARVPLSIVLYRSGDVRAARAEWGTMLRNRVVAAQRQQQSLPIPTSIDLLAQRRLDALAERAVPNWNPGFFDSGAGQHMVRGTALAKRRAYDGAALEWRTAERCSPTFQAPHLMLGYYAFLQGRLQTARAAWLAALEGIEMTPGDMAGISNWQYDAMAALLRYTQGG
jgi:hypothetical protein